MSKINDNKSDVKVIKEWCIGVKYNKNDIVCKYVYDNLGLIDDTLYYICNISHISDNLVGPWSNEEIYWSLETKSVNKVNKITKSVAKITKNTKNVVNKKKKIDQKSIDMIQEIIKQNNENNENKTVEKVESEKAHSEGEVENYTDYIENVENYREKSELKRKLKVVEDELEEYNKKRKMEGSIKLSIEERILLSDIDIETKSFLMEKYQVLRNSKDSEYIKGIAWLQTVVNLPFKKYTQLKITKNNKKDEIVEFFDNIKSKLDSVIYGLDETKAEILEFLARKITNPDAKGHVLALQGNAGVGKSKLVHTLADALNLPFHQINFGGINDESILTGHSETYTGSKPGKIVEILVKSGCCNPIIFIDEIDKASDNHKNKGINGILTHLLDEEQNDKFQDNYLSNINIDLSKVFFVIAFNDISKVNPIVLNRMKIIKIKDPSDDDKLIIAKEKLIPQIKNQLNKDLPDLSQDIIKYILNEKVPKESGVRQLKKTLEKLYNNLNYQILLGKELTTITINQDFIDNLFKNNQDTDTSYKMMYL